MTGRGKSVPALDREYAVTFENLRGVCYTENNDGAFSELENMYVDYSAGADAVESMPGYRLITALSGRVWGLYPQKLGTGEEYLVVHAGGSLYRFNLADRDSLASAELLSAIADEQSCAGTLGGELFILAGGALYSVGEGGAVSKLDSEDCSAAYVPTLFVNGEPKEDRNLLTDRFREVFAPGGAEELIKGSRELIYGNFNNADMTCSVTGIRSGYPESVHIPSEVAMGGRKYRVSAISAGALSNCEGIRELITNDGLETVGRYALGACVSLERVRLSSTVRTVRSDAFSGCVKLSELYLGAGLETLGERALEGCGSLTSVYYALDEVAFASVDTGGQLSELEVVYLIRDTEISLSLPLSSPAESIDSVTLNGEAVEWELDSEGMTVELKLSDPSEIYGATVTVGGTLGDGAIEVAGRGEEFAVGESGRQALLSCTVCEAFDGRLFLTGSKSAVGAVFYCSKKSDGEYSPLYFSARDHFTDGGNYGNVALLSSHGELAVCKSENDGSGSIFHTPKKEGELTLYPVTYAHSNMRVIGPAASFGGEALFVTDKGLFTLREVSGAEYRKPICRSDAVGPVISGLLGADTHLTEWNGYLVIQRGGDMLLCDPKSRRGGGEGYDWYPLTEIGCWKNDRKSYRYSTVPREGYHLHPEPDTVTTASAIGLTDKETGVKFYFHIDPATKNKYLLYYAGEMYGGSFIPASFAVCCSGLLIFGTENGSICVFNSDKRGVAPTELSELEGFDAEEYAAEMANRIHPLFYSHLGHAVRYLATSPYYDGGFPELEKRTVRCSETAALKTFCRGSLRAVSLTDTEGARTSGLISASRMCFEDVDFRVTCFDPSERMLITCAEGDGGWRRKRMSLYSDEYYRPFGVYSMGYRYKIKGKIKER